MSFITTSESATASFGLTLAKKARGGDIYALYGDLGGGKTTFTKGFAKGLGITEVIASPSFILMKVYLLKRSSVRHLCHVDAYRLRSPQEIIEVGLKEYMGRPDTITVIEWADKLAPLLKKRSHTILRFSFIDDHSRKIVMIKKQPTQKRVAVVVS